MRIASRLFTLTLLVGALTLAVSQSAGVRADNFTDVGCPTGNYACLAANRGQLPTFAAVGCVDYDYTCYYAKTGVNYAAHIITPYGTGGCTYFDDGCVYDQGYTTGITVAPYNPSDPSNQTATNSSPNMAFTSTSPDTAQSGVVTTTGR